MKRHKIRTQQWGPSCETVHTGECEPVVKSLNSNFQHIQQHLRLTDKKLCLVFQMFSKSLPLTAAMARSQSFRFQSKRNHTLTLSHQKCHRFPVMLIFFPLFPFIHLLNPNCDGWRLSGAGESWAVANTCISKAHHQSQPSVQHGLVSSTTQMMMYTYCNEITQ